MRWSDVVYLIALEQGVDDDGFETTVPVKSDAIYANKLPVYSNEFYQSAQVGITISKVFQIRSIEFSGQESLEHEGNAYRIRRVFDKGEFVELSCERKDDDYV